jgi:hypothetical protein
MAAFFLKALLIAGCVIALYWLITLTAKTTLNYQFPGNSLASQWQGIWRHL